MPKRTMIVVAMPPRDKERAQQAASASGHRSLSEWVRGMIYDGMRSVENGHNTLRGLKPLPGLPPGNYSEQIDELAEEGIHER